MPRLRHCLAALACLSGAYTSGAGAAEPADLVIKHAKIYTADAKRSMATALAVRDGKLTFVGSDAELSAWIGPKTAVRDAGGRLLLPGLFDSHIHATSVVQLDTCDLKNRAVTLKELSRFVQGCSVRYHVPAGEWVNVRQWNYSNGTQPDGARPTIRAALDLASRKHPIQLIGTDGHHLAFNSVALARAKNNAGKVIGYSKATLAADFKELRKLVGVDEYGEPNGTVNDEGRPPLGALFILDVDLPEVMKAPERITARLNSVGITGILDPLVTPAIFDIYDAIQRKGKLTLRATLGQYYDPDRIKTADDRPDWNRMVETAKAMRAKYASNPLLRSDVVKLFADGAPEGNPFAVPPTLPEVGALKPYLQPIFRAGKDGHLAVVGYVDTASLVCVAVRAHESEYESRDAVAAFQQRNGYHPGQCAISSGQLTHTRAVEMEFAKRFHLAGFGLHIHAEGEEGTRTAVDAIEAAREADGVSTTHDALAHVQLADPADVARIGRDHLYLALTYSWAYSDPEYDLSIVPFYDKVLGGDDVALHPANGYYEQRIYVTRSLRDAGAILVAGSDAPVNTQDPQPFVNMSLAVTRHLPGKPALTPAQSIPIRDVVDAYTISGARYLGRDTEAGSIEAGKSADFIVLDRDIFALSDAGKADDVARTQVLETWFMGKAVYEKPVTKAKSAKH